MFFHVVGPQNPQKVQFWTTKHLKTILKAENTEIFVENTILKLQLTQIFIKRIILNPNINLKYTTQHPTSLKKNPIRRNTNKSEKKKIYKKQRHTTNPGGYWGKGWISLVAIWLGNAALSPFLNFFRLRRCFSRMSKAACIPADAAVLMQCGYAAA